MMVKCSNCEYQWESRKVMPKACPRCKTRLDYISNDALSFDSFLELERIASLEKSNNEFIIKTIRESDIYNKLLNHYKKILDNNETNVIQLLLDEACMPFTNTDILRAMLVAISDIIEVYSDDVIIKSREVVS